MKDIDSLIDLVKYPNKNRYRAIEDLLGNFEGILPDLLKAIETSSWSEIPNMVDVIRQAHKLELIPFLIPLLDNENVYVRSSAIYALSNIQSKQSFDALYARLDWDKGWYYFAKERIIEALGNLGYPDAIPGIKQVLVNLVKEPTEPNSLIWLLENFNEDDEGLGLNSILTQILSCITSLAKFGNHEMDHLAVKLLRIGLDNSVQFDIETIMVRTVQTLKYIVSPGLISALIDANRVNLSDPYLIFETMSLIGVPEIIDEFVNSYAKDHNPKIAVSTFLEVVGQLPENRNENSVSSNELKNWWSVQRQNFDSLTIYRFGKPLNVYEIAEHIISPVFIPGHLISDLQIITGESFDYDIMWPPELQEKKIVKQIQHWIEEKPQLFKPGDLYRYGFRQEIKNIF